MVCFWVIFHVKWLWAILNTLFKCYVIPHTGIESMSFKATILNTLLWRHSVFNIWICTQILMTQGPPRSGGCVCQLQLHRHTYLQTKRFSYTGQIFFAFCSTNTTATGNCHIWEYLHYDWIDQYESLLISLVRLTAQAWTVKYPAALSIVDQIHHLREIFINKVENPHNGTLALMAYEGGGSVAWVHSRAKLLEPLSTSPSHLLFCLYILIM